MNFEDYDEEEVRDDFYDDYDEFSDCDCDLCNLPEYEHLEDGEER